MKQEHCPLSGGGNVNIDGKPIRVFGGKFTPNTKRLCAIEMLKRQKGLKAGFAKCKSCGLSVQVGEFSEFSSGSLTK